jgi:glycosyltransferase involved in cell wall biosynthesis
MIAISPAIATLAAVHGTVSVVHLCDYASPYPGSFVPMMSAAREAAESRGWQFEAVFGDAAQDRGWYGAARGEGMNVRAIGPLPLREQARMIKSLIAPSTPLIIHTHFAGWDLAAVLASRARRQQMPVAVVWHRHGTLSSRPWPLANALVKFGLLGRAVDAHLCVGPGTHAQLLARGSPRTRTLLLPNPVDVRRFRAVDARERARARAELGIDPDTELLVAFTWHWRLKGGPLLVEVVSELGRRGRPVVALAIGAGPAAEDAARARGLGTRIREVAARPDPRVFYAAADVFVAPGEVEGFGFAPLEALCCGTPVVASDIAAHRYHGRQLPAMHLSKPAPGPMADAVEQELTIGREDLAYRLAESRSYLERCAGPEVWMERLLHVYDAVLAHRGLGPTGRKPV